MLQDTHLLMLVSLQAPHGPPYCPSLHDGLKDVETNIHFDQLFYKLFELQDFFLKVLVQAGLSVEAHLFHLLDATNRTFQMMTSHESKVFLTDLLTLGPQTTLSVLQGLSTPQNTKAVLSDPNTFMGELCADVKGA